MPPDTKLPDPASGYTGRMFIRPSKLRRGTWMLLVAMLLGLLAPAWAHSLDLAPASLPMSEVCSAAGSTAKAGVADGRSDGRISIHAHCFACCLSSVQYVAVHGPRLTGLAATASNAGDLRWNGRSEGPLSFEPVYCPSQPRAPPQAH
jgi:hypothetical protein